MVKIIRMKQLTICLLVALAPFMNYANSKDINSNIGNTLMFLLPSSAAAIAFYKEDEDGLWQLGASELTTAGITYGLKYSVNQTGPNGDSRSFPSGHAAITFSAAQFLQDRYGLEYGLPAYLLAGYTAYSRVDGHYHYWSEVITGAAIGVISSHYFTEPLNNFKLGFTAGPKSASINIRTIW